MYESVSFRYDFEMVTVICNNVILQEEKLLTKPTISPVDREMLLLYFFLSFLNRIID
jgi:hypothetical protein